VFGRIKINATLAERRYSKMLMKVQVEKKPESVSTLKIELPPDESRRNGTRCNSFARLRGKFPVIGGQSAAAVIDRFRRKFQDEVTKKLVSKDYRAAIEPEEMRVGR